MSRILPALALCAALAPGSGEAQLNPLKSQIGLEQEDLEQMGAAAARLYEAPEPRPGSVEQWQSSTGASGSVRLVEAFEFDGMPCRRLAHTVQRQATADPQGFTVDRCQTADGEWKIR